MQGGSWKRGNLACLNLFKVIQPLPPKSPLAPKLSQHRNYPLTVSTQRWYQPFPRGSQNLELVRESSARPDCCFSPCLALWLLRLLPSCPSAHRAARAPLPYCFAWELQGFASAGGKLHSLNGAAVVFPQNQS